MKLFNLFNWVQNLVEAFTFYGSGGGSGGGGSQTSTSYSTNLPEYAQPFYNELLKQTGKNVFTTDTSGNVTGVKEQPKYLGERVAGFTPEQVALQSKVGAMDRPSGFGASLTGLGAGTGMGYGAAATGLGSALGYTAAPVTASTVGTSGFTPGAASYYMSPYASNVTDIAVREAERQRDLAKAAGMSGAIGRGTFGGARQALLQAEQGRNATQNITDIRNKGAQEAYTNAQAQFNADVARQQQAQQANQAAGLQAQQLTQQGQQYQAGLGKDIGLAGLQAGLQGSQQLGAMSATQQTSDLQRLAAQSTNAAEKQALQQKIDDLSYQTAMEQRDWQQKQLEFYSNILRGNAGALGSTQVQYTQGPQQSPLAGLGTGLQALSLAKSLT